MAAPLIVLTLAVLAFAPIHIAPIGPLGQTGIEWIMHTLGGGSVAVLVWLGSRHLCATRPSAHLASILGGMAAGVGVELIQTKIPYRSGSLSDLAPDALGIVLGQLLIWGLFMLNQRRRRPLKG